MNYRNSEMKIDQLVGYLNEEKINLSPAFQRGHVWSIGVRKKLLKNMIQGKPIPSIFLYKEASGTKYSYNILDGKQRLESLILFIANKHTDLAIRNWHRYFFGNGYRKDAYFRIDLNGEKKAFHNLDEQVVRDFREYAIPTVEISMDEETSLDEIITLFVDINQQGVAVKRFEIVKAICKNDPHLRSVFELLALKQRRGQDVYYKMKRTDITRVLRRLQIVESVSPGNSKVNRMWEKLLEIALFQRARVHRKPVEILKGFITQSGKVMNRLKPAETRTLRGTFHFLAQSYSATTLGKSRLATDQTHFYTMVTSIINGGLLARFSANALKKKLATFGELLDGKSRVPRDRSLSRSIKRYQEISAKQTTDSSRRLQRERLFIQIISAL